MGSADKTTDSMPTFIILCSILQAIAHRITLFRDILYVREGFAAASLFEF